MSSSVVFLSVADDFPLALRAPLFPADDRAWRPIFVVVGVPTTACLGNICGEPALLCPLTSFVSPIPVFCGRKLHFLSVTSNAT